MRRRSRQRERLERGSLERGSGILRWRAMHLIKRTVQPALCSRAPHAMHAQPCTAPCDDSTVAASHCFAAARRRRAAAARRRVARDAAFRLARRAACRAACRMLSRSLSSSCSAVRVDARTAQHVVAAGRALPAALALGTARVAIGLAARGATARAWAERVRVHGSRTRQRLAVQEAAAVAKLASARAAPELAWLQRRMAAVATAVSAAAAAVGRRWLAAIVVDPTRPTVSAAIIHVAMQVGGSAALRTL